MTKHLIVILSLLLILTAGADAGDSNIFDAAVIAAAVADVGTTEWALHSNPDTREGNPLLAGGSAQRIIIKAAVTATVVLGARHLEKHGHKNWARGFRIGAIVLWSGAAVNNAILAKRRP